MPTIRKITAEEADHWARSSRAQRTTPPEPNHIQELIAALADKRGITRIDRDGAAGGEHAWRARVYVRGIEMHRQFADARFGGAAGALREAVAWRDSIRQVTTRAKRKKPAKPPRIARADYSRMCGWLAYAPIGRRYFSDNAHGGRRAAHDAAQAWLAEQVKVARSAD